MNGIVYFIAEVAGFENGLYRTNGTSAGTWLVKGFNEGINDLSVVGNSLLFTHDYNELWVSNGARAGTRLLKRFSSITNLVSLNGKVVLYSGREINGEDFKLGRSNGVLSGTFMLNVIEDCLNSDPHYRRFAYYPGDVLYLNLSCGADLANSIWKTDGTHSGTVKLKVIKNLWTFFLDSTSGRNIGYGTKLL